MISIIDDFLVMRLFIEFPKVMPAQFKWSGYLRTVGYQDLEDINPNGLTFTLEREELPEENLSELSELLSTTMGRKISVVVMYNPDNNGGDKQQIAICNKNIIDNSKSFGTIHKSIMNDVDFDLNMIAPLKPIKYDVKTKTVARAFLSGGYYKITTNLEPNNEDEDEPVYGTTYIDFLFKSDVEQTSDFIELKIEINNEQEDADLKSDLISHKIRVNKGISADKLSKQIMEIFNREHKNNNIFKKWA